MTDTLKYSSPIKSEEKFRSLVNESLYGYVELDLEGYFTFANSSAEEITGYRVEDNINFKDAILDEDLERAVSDLELVMTKSNAGPREYRIKRKDNVIIDIEVNTLPIKRQNEIIGFQSTMLDISARKKIERQLAKSEMQYRSILETMEDEYFEFDLEGNTTFFNRSSIKKSGLKEDELAGLNYKDTMDPKTAARVSKAFNTIYMTGQPAKVEMGLYYKDEAEGIRKKRYIENSAQLMKDEEGRKIGFRCVLRDITERKIYERAIRENELKYTKLFESLREGIIISDSDGKIEEINSATLDMLGYTDKKELIGKKTVELYADAMQREAVFKELNRNGFVNNYELTFIKSDNTLIDTVGSAAFRRDNEGNVIGVEGLFFEITEKKRIEKELKESEEEYRTLVQTSNDLIFHVDQEGTMMFANNAFKKILGYDQNELIGKSCFGFVHREDLQLVESKLAELLERKNVENVEFRHITKTGQYVTISINASPLYDSQKNVIGIMGIGRDVSELKKVQDNLKESEAKYKSLVTGLMDGIVIARGEKILYANEKVGEMFGYANVKEMLGNPM
ncbi:MAG: PAS domain S-box protein, partial [Deltaproteobacteria bacterium]|nr:PAS domain S-box protein [Deltaproteobacteria bacterium]